MSSYRILISDPISSKGVDALNAIDGIEATMKTDFTPESLLKAIGDYDALIVRSQTKVTSAVFEAGKKLKAVGRAGVGIDNIDINAATQQGVVVINTPSGNTISTTEHAFSLMLSMARHIPQAHASMIAGRWDRKKFQGIEINKKKLAIIGMGRIGTEFSKRAQAFGMKITAYDPFLSEYRAQALKIELAKTIEEALEGAQVVTLHIPLNDDTHHLLNEKRIQLLAKNALIINCARGGLIDENALAQAIDKGQIKSVALDVYETEPPSAENPLIIQANNVFTPHLGASTSEAQENVGIQVADQIADYLVNDTIRFAVNMPSIDPQTSQALQPYLPLATGLGKFLYALGFGQAQSLEVSYQGAISELDTSLMTRTVLQSYLSAGYANINLINAPNIAKSNGCNVVESKYSELGDYKELIQVILRKDDQIFKISGTLIANKARIVLINDNPIEFNISKHFLVTENQDHPGMVGILGITLEKYQHNIANMALSRTDNKPTALNVIEIDQPVSQDCLDELANVDGILSVKSVSLSN